jgi:uncharacterized protein YkwD
MIRALAVALAAATMAGAVAMTAAPAFAQTQPQADGQAQVNAYRASKGLNALALDATLTRLAQEHVNGNAAAEKLDHMRGGSIYDRLAAAGIRGVTAGEADVRGQKDVAGAIRWWQGSPIHNSILLLQGVRFMGFATARSASGRIYWTLIVSSKGGR